MLRELMLLVRDVVVMDVLPTLRPKPKQPLTNLTKAPLDPNERKEPRG